MVVCREAGLDSHLPSVVEELKMFSGPICHVYFQLRVIVTVCVPHDPHDPDTLCMLVEADRSLIDDI